MLRLSLAYFVLLSACVFDPADGASPVDAPQPPLFDARAAAPVQPPPLPPAEECSCTVVGPESYPMTLPFSANTSYVAGVSQVKSADLNDIQAQIVANIGDLITAMGGAAPDDLLTMFKAGAFDGSQFWIREQLNWGPTDLSLGASQSNVAVITGKAHITSGSQTSLLVQAPGVPAAPCPHSALRLRHLDASTNSGILIHQANTGGTIATSFRTIDDLDSVRFVMDWRAYLTAVGTNQLDVYMGLHEEPTNTTPDDATAHSFAMFRKLSSDTNWQGRFANDTSGTTVNTSVAPVANTWQHFRLEYNGLSTPVGVAAGGVPVARLYINGTKVAENSGTAPSGAVGMGFMFAVYSTATGPSGDQDLLLSPVRMQWNPVAL